MFSVLKFNYLLYIFLLTLFVQCNPFIDNSPPIELTEIIDIEYAKGLSMYQTSEGVVVTITNPQSNEILDHFLVTDKDNSKLSSIKVIQKPFKSVLAYSSTYISFMDAIDEVNKVTGVTYSKGISNPIIKKRLNKGLAKDVGSDQSPDKELIISLKPDLAMIYPSNGNHNWFSSFDVPTIKNVEYLEVHPLAQAEWIKLYGVLFDKETEASKVFETIKKNYISAKNYNIISENKPVVLCGELYDGTWTLPGGKSFTSQLIEDAGGIYFLESDSTSGSKKLDFEYILEKDSIVDFWLLLSYSQSAITFSYLKENKPRYSYLSIFEPTKIGVCNTATSPYFEKGILEPHILLNEIKSLIHGVYKRDTSIYFKPISNE
jgi:iron complex transport system substrate-binding protein